MPDTNQASPNQIPPLISPGQVSDETLNAPPPQPSLPPMVTGEPKKKSKGGRIIATILGFMLLVGGIVGGVVLTQQQQDIREKAVGPHYEGPVPDVTVNEVGAGQVAEGCVVENVTTDANGNQHWTAVGRLAGCGGGGSCDIERNCPPGTTIDWSQATLGCVHWESSVCGNAVRKGGNKDCGYMCNCPGEDCQRPCKIQSAEYAACIPNTAASCQNVRAYSATWTPLTSAQLSAAADGTVVNFCVNGASTGAGTFDKAQFKIKDALQTETTTRRPDSTDFCQSYTVLPADTTIDVKAKIHHTTLGWKGESI